MERSSWDDLDAVLARAHTAQQSGDLATAYQYFSRATELNPNLGGAWEGRAATTRVAGDAMLSLAYALALRPDGGKLREQLHERVGERLASAGAADAEELIQVGRKLAEVGLAAEAQRVLRRATELDPTKEDALIWLAATTDNDQEAEAALRQVLGLNPQNRVAQAGLESLLQKSEGRRSAAAPAATPSQPSAPEPGAELIKAAEHALDAGDRPRAYKLFVEATQVTPRSEAAWIGRSKATDDVDEAITCLEQVLAINPSSLVAREARTFYRVRKLREGMRKTSGDRRAARFIPTARGGEATASPGSRARGARVVLLILIVLLVAAAFALYYLNYFPR